MGIKFSFNVDKGYCNVFSMYELSLSLLPRLLM